MEVRIGFEVHQQIATSRKLYCNCPTNYQDVPPNTNICPICTGMPGAKPLPPNERAVDAAIELALMLGCKVVTEEVIYIQRKHYDYPDLPSGYQRTSLPIAREGMLEGVRIRELHLEEDPGQYDPVAGTVDFNRSGVPLVEVVTEPDIKSPEEARGFLRRLTQVLEYSGKVRPEAGGAMRADVNISLEGGGRVEVKNINSIRGVYRALKFEILRQKSRLERGEEVKRETRAYLESQMITVPMRGKEMEEDYRYIPDPDILPLVIEPARVERIRAGMPEPPNLRERRLMEQYGITRAEAEVIVSERALADLYEEVCREVDPRLAAQWFRTRLKKVLNYLGLEASKLPCPPAQLSKLLNMVARGEITPEQGELVLRELAVRPDEPREILQKLRLVPVEEKELWNTIDAVLGENRVAVEDFLSGEEKALDFLVGRVLQAISWRADPREIRKLLLQKLKSPLST
ncbi:MAG: Asp-tRNA(Asn)/Glu-tRNA(Gln) amidotransferase subunit GatB [Candidatus Hadarchaeales archaeon]